MNQTIIFNAYVTVTEEEQYAKKIIKNQSEYDEKSKNQLYSFYNQFDIPSNMRLSGDELKSFGNVITDYQKLNIINDRHPNLLRLENLDMKISYPIKLRIKRNIFADQDFAYQCATYYRSGGQLTHSQFLNEPALMQQYRYDSDAVEEPIEDIESILENKTDWQSTSYIPLEDMEEMLLDFSDAESFPDTD